MQMTSTYQLKNEDKPHQKTSHKQVNITILISDKVDFELKLIRREYQYTF